MAAETGGWRRTASHSVARPVAWAHARAATALCLSPEAARTDPSRSHYVVVTFIRSKAMVHTSSKDPF
eukprot:scaffold42173_cov37-Phaeocystis_antarctica.AAC.1